MNVNLKIQRIYCAICSALLVTVAQGAPKSKDPATSKDTAAVAKAYYEWCAAVGNAHGDIKKILPFYAPGATLLPTLAPALLSNTYQRRSQRVDNPLADYFVHFTSKPNIHCHTDRLLTTVDGAYGIDVGFYTFTYAEHGMQKKIPARFTFIYEKRGQKWLIVHQQSSRVPKSA